MTNADKIRTMPIEEMAKFFMNKDSCPKLRCPKSENYFADCKTCWENWLKDECEGEV